MFLASAAPTAAQTHMVGGTVRVNSRQCLHGQERLLSQISCPNLLVSKPANMNELAASVCPLAKQGVRTDCDENGRCERPLSIGGSDHS